MADYLQTVWRKIKDGRSGGSFVSLTGIRANLIVQDDRGVVVDHQRGVKKVKVSMSNDIATVIAEYPLYFHDGNKTKDWVFGRESIEDGQWET